MRHLCIIVVTFLVLLVLINHLYVGNILPKKNFYKKEVNFQEYLNEKPDKNIDFIFFGDSHPFHAVNPFFITNSYNYGSGSEGYVKTYFKLRKLLEQDNVSVGAVVFQLDPHTFSDFFSEGEYLFNELPLYSKFTSLSEIKGIRTEDSYLSLWIESYYPVIGRGSEFGILVKSPEWSTIYRGWLNNTSEFNDNNKSASVERTYNLYYKDKNRVNNLSLEYFIKSIEYAHEHNIPIVFVRYPHSKEYDAMLHEKNIALEPYTSDILEQINRTLGPDYHYLDYYSLFFNDSSVFGDDAHLNYRGAEVFSKRLSSDLNALNLTEDIEDKSVVKNRFDL